MANVKDSVTFGLPLDKGSEASGSGELADYPVARNCLGGIDDANKDLLIRVQKERKPQKKKLLMDPIMGIAPPHMDYLVNVGEDGGILLMGKSTGM